MLKDSRIPLTSLTREAACVYEPQQQGQLGPIWQHTIFQHLHLPPASIEWQQRTSLAAHHHLQCLLLWHVLACLPAYAAYAVALLNHINWQGTACSKAFAHGGTVYQMPLLLKQLHAAHRHKTVAIWGCSSACMQVSSHRQTLLTPACTQTLSPSACRRALLPSVVAALPACRCPPARQLHSSRQAYTLTICCACMQVSSRKASVRSYHL
jgi:hypothetical protein